MEFAIFWLVCGVTAFCISIYKDWRDGEDITVYLVVTSVVLLALGVIGLAIITYLSFQTFLHTFGEKTLVKGKGRKK